MFPVSRIAIGLSLIAAAPAAAQNATASPAAPPATVAPPPPGPVTPSPIAPPPTPAENDAPPQNVTAATPAPAPPPPAPVEINPDAAYPNGFADPIDPAATNLQDAPSESRFPWGLLGLLGLFGLIPLFRRGGRVSRTVYVDRDDPKRVLREERIED